MNFIYTLKYDDTTSPDGVFLCNAKMYEVADFYIIPSLQKLAITKFQDSATTHWSNEQFLQAVEYIYDSATPQHELPRSIAMQIATDNSKDLLANPAFINMLLNIEKLKRDFTLSLLSKAVMLITSEEHSVATAV